jgi:hypothetical protein
MRGKKAKKLRKEANIIANEGNFTPENSKIERGGTIMWNKFCPKGVYKRLKRERQ